MDGKQHFQRAVATDRLDDTQRLQAFYELSHADGQTNTVPARRGWHWASDPRLNETRTMPATA
jgi:hypothetical protein